MAKALQAAASAKVLLETDDADGACNRAYYAMFDAARAALLCSGAPVQPVFGDGLFELRLKGAEGIARVFFCTLVGKRIVMLHSFIKKSERTPRRERDIAVIRMKEVNNANS